MKKLLFVVGILLLSYANVWATTYPSDLHFGQLNGSGGLIQTPLYNGEVNLIASDSAAMQIMGNVKGTLVSADIFLGIAGGTSSPLPPDFIKILPSTTVDIAPTFVTSMTQGQEAYSLLGLSGANNSQSWTNWSAAYGTLITGSTYTGDFGLYRYQMNADALAGLAPLAGGTAVGFDFASDLPAGTFVFGDVMYSDLQGKRQVVYNDFVTAFTNTGMNTPVPEPSTFLLLSAGLFGLAVRSKRTRKDPSDNRS